MKGAVIYESVKGDEEAEQERELELGQETGDNTGTGKLALKRTRSDEHRKKTFC